MNPRCAGLLLAVACGGNEPGPPVQPPIPLPTPSPFEGYDCEGAGPDAARVTFWRDDDGDGHGDPQALVQACSHPPGHARQAGDCDDTRSSIHPGAAERCNEHDDDCDGTVDEDDAVDAVPWFADGDGDSYRDPSLQRLACMARPGWVREGAEIDCDDDDVHVHPGAPERCNGLDDDCDGTVDGEQAQDVLTWYLDADGDGFGDPLTTQLACAAPIGFIEPGAHADCDDRDAAVHPSAQELCNGVDDDCDGVVDEDDAFDAVPWYADTDGDRFGDASIPVISCRPPAGYVSSPGDCDDLRATTHLGAEELCNGADDDCDGEIDEADASDAITWFVDGDGDRFGDPNQPLRACKRPKGARAVAGDCDDTRPSAHPESVEVCNGHDDDCDGSVDEPDADDAITWYADSDRDGFGDRAQPLDACYQPTGYVSPRGDCDDSDPAVHPGASEPPDGIDNDCNGIIDDGGTGG
jgi:large repetitive protein